jgi:hypothetical protein
MLLHTEAFTHRSFDAQMLLHTHTGLVFVQATVCDYAEGSYKMSLCTKWLWPAGLPQAIKYLLMGQNHGTLSIK